MAQDASAAAGGGQGEGQASASPEPPSIGSPHAPVLTLSLAAALCARVVSETGKPAADTGAGCIYTRRQDQFEQVMAYHWVTQAQRYIQSLGFGSTLPAVNRRQQLLRINEFGGDDLFYREGTGKLTITLGKGGVDDAEDAEAIIHEYGHSVQDNQVPGFGSSPDAGAIGEAFGDYLAVTVSAAFAPTADEACVADWDSTSDTTDTPHCLWRVDGNKPPRGRATLPRSARRR